MQGKILIFKDKEYRIIDFDFEKDRLLVAEIPGGQLTVLSREGSMRVVDQAAHTFNPAEGNTDLHEVAKGLTAGIDDSEPGSEVAETIGDLVDKGIG